MRVMPRVFVITVTLSTLCTCMGAASRRETKATNAIADAFILNSAVDLSAMDELSATAIGDDCSIYQNKADPSAQSEKKNPAVKVESLDLHLVLDANVSEIIVCPDKSNIVSVAGRVKKAGVQQIILNRIGTTLTSDTYFIVAGDKLLSFGEATQQTLSVHVSGNYFELFFTQDKQLANEVHSVLQGTSSGYETSAASAIAALRFAQKIAGFNGINAAPRPQDDTSTPGTGTPKGSSGQTDSTLDVCGDALFLSLNLAVLTEAQFTEEKSTGGSGSSSSNLFTVDLEVSRLGLNNSGACVQCPNGVPPKGMTGVIGCCPNDLRLTVIAGQLDPDQTTLNVLRFENFTMPANRLYSLVTFEHFPKITAKENSERPLYFILTPQIENLTETVLALKIKETPMGDFIESNTRGTPSISVQIVDNIKWANIDPNGGSSQSEVQFAHYYDQAGANLGKLFIDIASPVDHYASDPCQTVSSLAGVLYVYFCPTYKWSDYKDPVMTVRDLETDANGISKDLKIRRTMYLRDADAYNDVGTRVKTCDESISIPPICDPQNATCEEPEPSPTPVTCTGPNCNILPPPLPPPPPGPCDPTTDPNCTSPCDPTTGSNCTPPCDPATGQNCNPPPCGPNDCNPPCEGDCNPPCAGECNPPCEGDCSPPQGPPCDSTNCLCDATGLCLPPPVGCDLSTGFGCPICAPDQPECSCSPVYGTCVCTGPNCIPDPCGANGCNPPNDCDPVSESDCVCNERGECTHCDEVDGCVPPPCTDPNCGPPPPPPAQCVDPNCYACDITGQICLSCITGTLDGAGHCQNTSCPIDCAECDASGQCKLCMDGTEPLLGVSCNSRM